VSFAGKTDPQIAHELLAGAGRDREQVEPHFGALWLRYVELLDTELQGASVHVFPGVEACLARCEREDDRTFIGLLTGNVREGARRKVEASGLGFDRFHVGGFGSDSEHRNELPEITAQRAEQLTGERFRGRGVVVVGDTPADIACGEAFGATTVAVATGTYSREQLAACNPDFLFDSHEDTDQVFAALVS
jgi:phosphoglycolate phosphatase